MTRTLTSLGDRMLGALLKQKKAGACLPPYPCVSACSWKSGYCSGGVWWQPMCNGITNCMGNCTGSGSFVNNKKVAYGC